MVGTDWWDGNALWNTINTFGIDFFKDRAEMFLNITPLLQALAIYTVVVELFYPILIYYKKTRVFTLINVIAMHAGIGIVMGVHTFALVMIIMNLIAFGHYFNVNSAIKLLGLKKFNLTTLHNYV